MRTLEASIDIDASPEAIWSTLLDFPAYPDWNPFIVSIVGEPRVGERLDVRIRPPGSHGIGLKPVVRTVEPSARFGWLGHLVVPRIFDGGHEFVISPRSDGGSTFVQREEFGGVLVPLVGKMLARTLEGFEAMNAALKVRVEERSTSRSA